jgi:hypothetical protein
VELFLRGHRFPIGPELLITSLEVSNFNETDSLGELGVAAVNLIVRKEMEWIFRQQSISDRGIDAEIEIQDEAGDATGRLIALQIKTGPSYLSKKTDTGFVFRGKNRHLSYWRRHSLPVVLVLHDPGANVSYWQSVSDSNIEKTDKAWKIEVPFNQTFDKSAMKRLYDLAEGPIYERRVRRLVLDRPWMLLLENGERLFLEAEEWINKSSGRGSLALKARDEEEGSERLVQDWPFVMFPGWPYEFVFRQLFPWADLSVDEEFYHDRDEELFDDACGMWDGEDKRYIGHTEDFREWRSGLPELRPYQIDGGEVARYRLELVLNEVGRAFMMLDRFLETGERPGGPNPERFSAATHYGLKGLAMRYLRNPLNED